MFELCTVTRHVRASVITTMAWIWSSSLVLTLHRLCLTLLIYLNLLMRKIKQYLSNTIKYTWLSIKKFVKNKTGNYNNHNSSYSNHPIIGSHYNINNTNSKENKWRPRKKITFWMRIQPKKLRTTTFFITILLNCSNLYNLRCRNCIPITNT